ncbi:uroporphyrinogen-III C-methyltransferase [Novisyntrophococcus fermenticellae]|uniref:uroporphyrinogen-III C-methyltransferase n=1 Tax=Novisyntrophococcus fermenticellae TaxID=2068655 RepID=UPI001E286C8E|nr:uroporphyrinogen-III C-methyltransferase [Novisyntrophococcus fermenticellae]
MNTGKVWLVGAGPGDAGLLTRKAEKVLKQAEVVVYDRLVGDGVLAMIPKTARTIDVGKNAGNHTKKQEEINQILLEEAGKGYRVVRLKGGDPFLFGRGGEELELLVQQGIPFEVVPGVTSPIAVPAYNGIPVTHRDFCSSLHIITGHKKAGDDYDIDFEALVRTKGTLVFLMGVSALADICQSLTEAGMEPGMPAAVLQQGTTAGQKRIVATVSTLPDEVERQGIETPAIIVVGKVCTLAKEFEWYEKLPLSGFKVVITRPKDLNSQSAEKLRRKGAEVLELPAIETKVIEENKKLENCLKNLDDYQWIAFTSPTGVRIFFEQMQIFHCDIRNLMGCKFAAVGKGTCNVLQQHGIYADLVPEIYDGASLGMALAENCSPKDRILLPRACGGNMQILEEIRKGPDLVVDDVPTYTTIYERAEYLDEQKLFEKGKIDCAVFTSAGAVKGFAEATKGLDYSLVTAACIGKQTKAAADICGMKTYMAKEATMDSLVDLVIEMKEKKVQEQERK